jgi:hypothetical protein
MKYLHTFSKFINESVANLIQNFPKAKTNFFINYDSDEISLREIFTKTSNEPMIVFGVGNKKGKKASVNLEDLIPTQNNVSKDVLLKKLDDNSKELPTVAVYNNKHYIIQGHHRLALEKLKGGKQAFVQLITVKS